VRINRELAIKKESSMEKDTKEKVYVMEINEGNGQIRIANDVVARIACLAAMEVKGVASMAEDITSELLARVGVKTLSKGAKVEINGEYVAVDMTVVIKYGVNIPSVCEKIQGRVRSQIETMTGLKVNKVNVRVSAVTGE